MHITTKPALSLDFQAKKLLLLMYYKEEGCFWIGCTGWMVTSYEGR